MKNLILFFLFMIGVHSSYAASINLLEAKNQKKVSVAAKGRGGYIGECINLSLKNLTSVKQDIEISPGLIFTSQDSTAQDLMVVEQYRLALLPGATQILNVYTMCIKQHNLAPAEGNLFALNGEARGHLFSLSELIASKNYHNSTAQSAVWTLTDKAEMTDIYASDTTMAGQLATFIANATGMPRPKIITPKEHYIYSIRMNITYHFSKSTKATLACFDGNGNLIKEYYKNRTIPIGMYIATFGINKVADKGTKFIYRLSDDKGNILKERIITESVNDPKPKKWKLDIAFEYVLEKPVNGATMSLYDDKGNLMESLYTNRNLPAGGRRQSYTFHHTYGPTATFYIRLKDNTGKVIVEQKLDGSKSVKVL
jgi:hypothetical protein